MPRRGPVRAKRATDLRAMIARGPSWNTMEEEKLSAANAEEATCQYRRWVETWVLPELDKLVPELKKKEDAK